MSSPPLELPIFQADAFTSACFGGNPAAVCVLDADAASSEEADPWLPLDAGLMQKIAQENNLAETAFCVKDGGDASASFPRYLLRWFTPEIEMDLCGHATLASAHVLLTEYEKQARGIRFYSAISGELEVTRVEGKEFRYRMLLPSRPPAPVPLDAVPEVILRGVGGTPKRALKSRDYLLIYDSEEEVRALSPDATVLGRINIDPGGVIATAEASKDGVVDFVSRFFTPGCSVFEDPVTGSAHCSLVPYWSRRLNRRRLVAKQISARGGTLFCEELDDDGDGEGKVAVEGDAVTYLRGSIFVPRQ